MSDKYRHIKSIMRKYRHQPRLNAPISLLREFKLNKLFGKKTKPLEVFRGISPKSLEHNERMKVFHYFYKQKLNDEDIFNRWYATHNEKYSFGREYKKRPKRERKDNLNPNTNTVNFGSGGGGYSSIRVPSKKRKNRMKNFKKMFPNFKIK
jgi:hypothetical protein